MPSQQVTPPAAGATAANYVMIGGFLGAGKTTAMTRFAEWLRGRGHKVGLITNDQGSQLVDSFTLRSRGFTVEEIPGGCFCCRFDSLREAAARLQAADRPDTFLAEPVGSCTDLVATVTYPLRRMYGDNFRVAPLSVVLDPIRAARILGVELAGQGIRRTSTFSPKVAYIYLKQLEEADVLVVNKIDSLGADDLARLDAALAEQFPRAARFAISARAGTGMEAWFTHVLGTVQGAGLLRETAMAVDYDTYAEGEALLGWLNATVAVDARTAASDDGNRLVADLLAAVQQRLPGSEIAHLKMTLSPDDGSGELATGNLVRGDLAPEMGTQLSDGIGRAQLIINLRAEAGPDLLRSAVEGALAAHTAANAGLKLAVEHLEHFRPGRPTPTHRLANAGTGAQA